MLATQLPQYQLQLVKATWNDYVIVGSNITVDRPGKEEELIFLLDAVLERPIWSKILSTILYECVFQKPHCEELLVKWIFPQLPCIPVKRFCRDKIMISTPCFPCLGTFLVNHLLLEETFLNDTALYIPHFFFSSNICEFGALPSCGLSGKSNQRN